MYHYNNDRNHTKFFLVIFNFDGKQHVKTKWIVEFKMYGNGMCVVIITLYFIFYSENIEMQHLGSV